MIAIVNFNMIHVSILLSYKHDQFQFEFFSANVINKQEEKKPSPKSSDFEGNQGRSAHSTGFPLSNSTNRESW